MACSTAWSRTAYTRYRKAGRSPVRVAIASKTGSTARRSRSPKERADGFPASVATELHARFGGQSSWNGLWDRVRSGKGNAAAVEHDTTSNRGAQWRITQSTEGPKRNDKEVIGNWRVSLGK